MKTSLSSNSVDMTLPSNWFWVDISRKRGKYVGIARSVIRLRETIDNQLVDDILEGNPDRVYIVTSVTKSFNGLVKSINQKIQSNSYEVVYLRDILVYPPVWGETDD